MRFIGEFLTLGVTDDDFVCNVSRVLVRISLHMQARISSSPTQSDFQQYSYLEHLTFIQDRGDN